jgi:hypothetical protein
MKAVNEASIPANSVTPGPSTREVSLFRLYTLRVAYLIMSAGIGVFFWPSVIHHTREFATAHGIQFALLGGLGLTAALGLRYPLRMLPILLFELTWKAIYLIAFALPLCSPTKSATPRLGTSNPYSWSLSLFLSSPGAMSLRITS